MPNGIVPVGDDPKWKREVDKELRKLLKEIEILKTRQGRG